MADEQTQVKETLVTITLDGREVTTAPGELVIQAAQDAGTYIPHFCWHPRMNPVGMCRMCLVEIETPRGTIMTTSCTTPVGDGQIVRTDTDAVKKAQEGILEFLLLNHPLDCPVCDKGGECPLQDQAFAYGPGESRMVEEKRHYEKPIPISDLVLLDRERCILCARCTRFSDEISGDPLIEFMDRGNATQVNTFTDEPFASYFSGNTVQICPVGALTATAYRFRARPWDLHAVRSVAMFDTVGSSITVQSSQNEVLRFLGVDNDATNHGWLDDKTRFAFEYINSKKRLAMPLIRRDGELVQASWPEALEFVADRLSAIRDEGGRVAALGGARGTNEDAYALSKFMRVAAESNNVDAQMGDGLDPQLLVGVADKGRINDLESAKTILLWGPDLKEELPVLYLRVRRAAQELGATLIVVHPRATGLDDRASHKFTYRPGQGAKTLARLSSGLEEFADARAALNEGPVVVITGRTGYAEDPRLAESIAAFARTIGASVLPVVRRGNTYGALDMGLSPMLLPGRVSADSESGREALEEVWGPLPDAPGRDSEGISAGVADGSINALLLVGADPVRDSPGGLSAEALSNLDLLVSIDLFITDSNRDADVILPGLSFSEKEGTFTNLEGRVMKVNQLTPGPGQSRSDWSILDDLATKMDRPINLAGADSIAKEIESVAPSYAGITWERLEWDDPDGVVAPVDGAEQPLVFVPVEADLESASHETVLHLARTLYDDGVMVRRGPSLQPLAPGGFCGIRGDHAADLGVAEGDMVTVTGSLGAIDVPVRIDDSLASGTVHVPFNQPDLTPIGDRLSVYVKAAR